MSIVYFTKALAQAQKIVCNSAKKYTFLSSKIVKFSLSTGTGYLKKYYKKTRVGHEYFLAVAAKISRPRLAIFLARKI